MPDIQDRKDSRFSRYDAMSTEDLQAFLREDASKPMGEESDTKEILYVMASVRPITHKLSWIFGAAYLDSTRNRRIKVSHLCLLNLST